jgi:hypothetical protein
MATYKQIQDHIRDKEGFVVKTCWIAHVKADYGLTSRAAPNRIDASDRVAPCPLNKRRVVVEALRHFGMI